jgi:hypothetical protein
MLLVSPDLADEINDVAARAANLKPPRGVAPVAASAAAAP